MKRALTVLFVLVVLGGILTPLAAAPTRVEGGSVPSVERFLASLDGPKLQTKSLSCNFQPTPPGLCVQWASCCSHACAACGGVKTVHCFNPYSCECNAPGCV